MHHRPSLDRAHLAFSGTVVSEISRRVVGLGGTTLARGISAVHDDIPRRDGNGLSVVPGGLNLLER